MAEIHGHVFDVVEERKGDEIAVAAAAGATSITVVNVLDFDVNRSIHLPDDQIVQVTGVTMNEDRSGVLTLATPTATALEVGDRVDVWSEAAQTVVSEWIASVRDSADGSVIQAPIAHSLIATLPDGADAVHNASVVVAQDESGRRSVVEAMGKKPRYDGSQMRSFTSPSGLPPVEELGPAAYFVSRESDGTVIVTLSGPDLASSPGLIPTFRISNGPAGSSVQFVADSIDLPVVGDGDVGTGSFRDSVDARVAAVGGGISLGVPSGNYWPTPDNNINSNSGFSGLNRMIAIPVILGATTTFDRIGLLCSGSNAGALVRFGIYADNGKGQPGACVLDAGTVALTSTGLRQVTISQTLNAGVYHLVTCQQGTATADVRFFQPNPYHHVLTTNGPDNYTFSVAECHFRDGISGALPSTFGSTATAGAGSSVATFLRAV